jgi:hypothetical protein
VSNETGRRLSVDPVKWLHGPARIEGEFVVLDPSRARPYFPIAEQELVYDLAAVRRPQDALAFVQRYGLLTHGPDANEHREALSLFVKEALSVTFALTLYLSIRKAVGSEALAASDAIRELREFLPEFLPELGVARKTTDHGVIDLASRTVAGLVNSGLVGVESKIEHAGGYEEGERGDFLLSARSPTLRGLIYHQLALLITTRFPLRTCAESECGRFFPVRDKRQQFCSATCSGRARQRRWAERRTTNTGGN